MVYRIHFVVMQLPQSLSFCLVNQSGCRWVKYEVKKDGAIIVLRLVALPAYYAVDIPEGCFATFPVIMWWPLPWQRMILMMSTLCLSHEVRRL
jgi:hypothetical protein